MAKYGNLLSVIELGGGSQVLTQRVWLQMSGSAPL